MANKANKLRDTGSSLAPVFVCSWPKESAAPLLRYLRGIGAAAFVFGIGGLMLTLLFWPASILILFAFALYFVDVWLEKSLSWPAKVFLSACFIGLAGLFLFGIVLYKAEVAVRVIAHRDNYPAGTSIHGIIWKPEYTDVRIRLANPSERDFDDLDVGIQLDQNVFAHAFTSSGVPCEFLDDAGDAVWPGHDANGNKVEIPLRLDAIPHFRVRCPKLPKFYNLEIVIAAAKMGDYKSNDFAKVYRATPQSALIVGSYVALLKPYHFHKQMGVDVLSTDN